MRALVQGSENIMANLEAGWGQGQHQGRKFGVRVDLDTDGVVCSLVAYPWPSPNPGLHHIAGCARPSAWRRSFDGVVPLMAWRMQDRATQEESEHQCEAAMLRAEVSDLLLTPCCDP